VRMSACAYAVDAGFRYFVSLDKGQYVCSGDGDDFCPVAGLYSPVHAFRARPLQGRDGIRCVFSGL